MRSNAGYAATLQQQQQSAVRGDDEILT